jgi:hypothetical protein
MKVTSLPASSSACESNWSNYDFIHSKKRNKLKTDRAEQLVWVHSNGRLLRAQSAPADVLPWHESGSDSDDDSGDGEDSEEGNNSKSSSDDSGADGSGSGSESDSDE